MNASATANADLRYAAMQVAVSRFGDSLTKLTAEEKEQVEKLAATQVAIQSKVLNSPESAAVVIGDNDVNTEVGNIVARFPSREDFCTALKNFDLTEDSFKRAVLVSLRVDATMTSVAASVAPCTETDAKLYYYMNPNKFFRPETRQASHILITVNPDYPENERSASYKRAQQVSLRLQKKPKRFSEQAMKYSECPTAMNGGTLGTLKRGTLFPSLDKELFRMKSGSVSDVIESPMGFHVLYCETVTPEGLVPLPEALPSIQEKLTDRNRKAYQRAWLKSL